MLNERDRIERNQKKDRSVTNPLKNLPGPGRISLIKGAANLKNSLDFSMIGIDRTLLFLLIGLTLFGIVMVTSTASYNIIRSGEENIVGYMLKQGAFALLGFSAMLFMAALDYHRLSWRLILLAGPLILFLNLLPPLVSSPVNGAYRWIYLGFISFQPSEFAKYYLVFLAAALMTMPREISRKAMSRRFFMLLAAVMVFGFVIVKLQSNLSTASIMVMAAIIIVLLSRIPKSWTLIPSAGILAAGVIFIFGTEYRFRRVMGFLDPFKDPTGDTLQVVQSLYALSMGGLFGRGLGNSRFKAFWLPFAENDFIYAIICEELGLLGGLAVLAAMLYLVLTGLRIARAARDDFGRFLSVGIVSIIGLQALINTAVVMGAFPVTGVPLPFISAGGTSLVMNLAAMGVVLNISRQGRCSQ